MSKYGLAVGFDTTFRRQNITKLELHRHFGPIDHRTGRQLIEVPGDETKNEMPLVTELRPRTAKLQDVYLTRFRPLIATRDCPFLFLSPGLGEADREQSALHGFSARVRRFVERRLYVDFTVHTLRSLLASVYAEANSEDERTAQLKLGHKNPQTTSRFYLAPRQLEVTRRFDALIEELIDNHGAPPRRLSHRESHDVR